MVNLSQIYAEYIDSLKDKKVRDPQRLFVSDVGHCPRSVSYRIQETEKNPVADQTLWNKTIMFDLAQQMEWRMVEALDHAGLLIAEQLDVDIFDRENWGGRFDFIADVDGIRVIEFKTANSNAFRHPFDRPDYRLQASVYHIYCEEEYGLDAQPLIPLFDRGGTNTYKWEEVVVEPEKVKYLMDELECVRNGMEAPQLEKVLVKRSYDKQIVLEPPWSCGWCDYSDVCKPDMGTSIWAVRKDNRDPWEAKKAADPVKLAAYCTSIVDEIL